MGFLLENENALKQNKIFFDELKKIDCKLRISALETREAGRAMQLEIDGVKHRFNSVYRPLQEAIKWADQYSFQNIETSIFMFGFGNGIFVRELLNRLPDESQVFVFEPRIEIFKWVCENEDISDLLVDSRLHLYFEEKNLNLFQSDAEMWVTWNNITAQLRCEHPVYQKIYTKEYHQFWDICDRVNDIVITKAHTNAYFGQKSIENVVKNLPFIKESNYITELMGRIPEDIPAIIVSAGPSLEKNVELLKNAQGKSLIIATDTAVRVLEEKGLPYDCIVTVDPGKPAWYLENYPECSKKPLFLALESQSEITAFHKGRKIWMAGSIYLDELYMTQGMTFPAYNVGGSVATSAYMLAITLGLKNIILIGQDLAFVGNKTHAGNHEDHIMNEEDGIQYIEGIDGEMVKSRRDWMFYLHWFEERIQEEKNICLIDATEGGALIHGSQVMKFHDAIERYCKDKMFDFEQFLKKIPLTFEVHDFEPIKHEIRSMNSGIANIEKKAKEAINLADELIGKFDTMSQKKHDRLVKEIKKANNYIGRQPGYGILDIYLSELTVKELRDINVVTGNPRVDELNSVQSAKVLYQGFIAAAIPIRKLLQEHIGQI